MASRLDFSQIRSLYIGTSSSATVGTDNLIVVGNVAVGTTSNTARLDVVGGTAMTSGWTRTLHLDANYPSISMRSGAGGNSYVGFMWDSGSNFIMNMGSNADLPLNGAVFAVNATTRNFLIGTTVDSGYKLAVAGDILASTPTGNRSVVLTTNNANAALNVIAGLGAELATDGTNQNIAFRTGVSTRMYIASGGNVGIGTTSPISKLNLNGGTGDGASYDAIFSLTRTSSTGNQLSSKIVLDDKDTNWGKLIFKVKTTASAAELDAYYTDAITIDNQNANVGIGTTSPLSKLSVSPSNNDGVGLYDSSNNLRGLLFINNTGGVFSTGIRTGNYWLDLDASGTSQNAIRMFTGTGGIGTGTERMRITAGGNVGINTTAPSARLQVVKGSSGNVASFTTEDNTIGAYAGITLNSTTQGADDWYGSEIRSINIQGNPNFLNPRLAFFVQNTNTYLPADRGEKMTILGNGNVGIGTTSPGALLQVGSGNNTSDALLRLGVIYDNSRSSRGGITWHDTSNTTGKIYTEYDGTMVSMVFGSLYSSGYNSNQLMIIRGNGNVGIGTTSPSEKLQVAGNGLFENNLFVGNGSASEYFLEIGKGRTGNGFAYIDLIGDATYTDYGLRILRNNSGANTPSSISHRGLGDLSITTEDAAPMVFSTSSAERMRITSAGNVGIGTSSPTLNTTGRVLHINASSNQASIVHFTNGTTGDSATDGLIVGRWSDGANYFYTYESEPLYFGAGNSVRMAITSDGNVGIGTTAPTVPLQIVNTNATISMTNSTAFAVDTGSRIFLGGKYNTAGTTTPFAWLIGAKENATDGNQAGYLSFTTTENGGGFAERMRITSTGNVGIGTTSPARKLQVEVGSTAQGGQNWSHSNGTVFARLGIVNPGVNNNTEFGSASNNDLVLLTVNAEKMRITSAGNVGIGTTSPGYKLDVVGDTRITSGSLGVGVAPNATDGRIDASNDIVAYQTSDQRLKENVTPIENALEKVKSLTGVEFDWIEEHKHIHGYEGHDTGVIAQQVQAVMPTAVRTNDSGYLSVRYEKMIALLIEGMKEQQKEIDELKKLIK